MDEAERAVSVTVEIGGETYAIRSNTDPAQVEKCARFVDESIQEVYSRAGLLDAHKATILAALSIAAQYYQTRSDLDDLRARMAVQSASIAEEIEAELAEGIESES